MTVRLTEVVSYLDTTLEVSRFRDYGPNGLQVEGAHEVDHVITGVSASLRLFDQAVERGADLIVVHHGLFWGHGIAQVTGVMARRLAMLLKNGVSLAAYHLPLDAHPILGNNAGLVAALQMQGECSAFGDVRGHALGVAVTLSEPIPVEAVLEAVGAGICGGQSPRFVFLHGPRQVRKIGICSGAASDLLAAAAEVGCDLFLTGELAERAEELSRELQVTLVAAGHYATEVFGPQSLARALPQRFPGLRAEFVDNDASL